MEQELLNLALVNTLTATPGNSESKGLSVPNSRRKAGPLNENSIKGVFVRSQKSHGIVMLAFFDERHAAIAKATLIDPTLSSAMAECVGDEPTEEGGRSWLSCEFVTGDELVKAIGHSNFLDSVDGSFYISVEGRESSGADKGELRVVDDRYLDVDKSSQQLEDPEAVDRTREGKREINLEMLTQLLKSFGALRSFSSAKSSDNEASFISAWLYFNLTSMHFSSFRLSQTYFTSSTTTFESLLRHTLV